MNNPTTYDSFTGPEIDAGKWMFLEYPMPDSEPWVCREPQSQITVADGRLSVDIDRFELEHAVQPIDNCKFVLLTTESFLVPADRKLVVSADMAAEGNGTTPYDWADGFASLIVIDPSTGLVFDAVATSDMVGAIHERLPFSEAPAFTRVVEAPLAAIPTGPRRSHSCEIVLDAAAGSAVWRIDDHEVFRADGIQIPDAVNVGLGIFTVRPVIDGVSQSLNGQGFSASWSNVTISAA